MMPMPLYRQKMAKRHTWKRENGIIDVVINHTKDGVILASFNVRIVDRKTNKPLIAIAEPATRADLTLASRKGSRWHFNWLSIAGCGELTYKITYRGKLQGLVTFDQPPPANGIVPAVNVEVAPHNLGHNGIYTVGPTLTAIVCKFSVDWGFEGFIIFRPKSELEDHYRESLGAFLAPNGVDMVVDDLAAAILIKDYII